MDALSHLLTANNYLPLSSSTALEVSGHLKAGEKVLVTAAAGGTGQFAVQLAKLAGCHVIATCGGPDKAVMLKRLGADRVIDYKTEDLQVRFRGLRLTFV